MNSRCFWRLRWVSNGGMLCLWGRALSLYDKRCKSWILGALSVGFCSCGGSMEGPMKKWKRYLESRVHTRLWNKPCSWFPNAWCPQIPDVQPQQLKRYLARAFIGWQGWMTRDRNKKPENMPGRWLENGFWVEIWKGWEKKELKI